MRKEEGIELLDPGNHDHLGEVISGRTDDDAAKNLWVHGGGAACTTPQPDHLSTHTRACLARLAIKRSWKRGDVLLHAGAVAPFVVAVEYGAVRASRMSREGVEALRTSVRLGSLLGLISVLSQRPFRFTISADAPCKTSLYDARLLMDAMRSDNAMAVDLACAVARWAQDCEDIGFESQTQPLVDRIYLMLQRLRQSGAGTSVPGGFRLNVTQYDVACMVGSTRTYVNPQLRLLQERGLVKLGYRSIILSEVT